RNISSPKTPSPLDFLNIPSFCPAQGRIQYHSFRLQKSTHQLFKDKKVSNYSTTTTTTATTTTPHTVLSIRQLRRLRRTTEKLESSISKRISILTSTYHPPYHFLVRSILSRLVVLLRLALRILLFIASSSKVPAASCQLQLQIACSRPILKYRKISSNRYHIQPSLLTLTTVVCPPIRLDTS
ncbi:hypothetical protein BGZ63DRAFT_500100, partial [Mariannaea sp. PMI_226]